MGDADNILGSDGNEPVQGQRVRNIVDLARLAGVSPGTVSRALAGNALVNIQTREKIEAIARAHDFRPNQMASRLRTKRTGLVGVVIPLGHERQQHLSDPFFMTMLGQLADRITETGRDIMLARVIPDSPDWLIRIVDSGMLDGVLLIGQSDQVEVIEQVALRYRPLVVWGHHRAGQAHCVVGVDNVGGGRLAAARLIERGARRLAFLGDIRTPEIAARHAGFVAAAGEAGLAVELFPTHLAVDAMEGEIAHHAAQIDGRLDGIFAASDTIAMRTLRALADRSVTVPDQVAMIGFDDLELASHTVPRLTTVRQDIAGGAATMVDALFRRMAGEDVASTVMAPTLIVRDSC